MGRLFDEILRPAAEGPRIGQHRFAIASADSGAGLDRQGGGLPLVVLELRSYGPLVTEGCYLVVADTLLGHFDAEQTPRNRSKVWLKGNEPLSALAAYLEETDRFEVDPVLNGKLILSSSHGGYPTDRGDLIIGGVQTPDLRSLDLTSVISKKMEPRTSSLLRACTPIPVSIASQSSRTC